MTDGAILAHHVFILENDARAGAIILRHVRTANKIDDLIRLDGAGARIHRIGADAREIVDFERRDRSVALDTDPSFAAVIAGMNIGIEAFGPVGDVLNRPPQQLRQRISCHFVSVDMNFDAEGSSDILADHANLQFLESQM